MMNIRISWVWIVVLFLGFTFHNLSTSQARSTRHKHHPTAVVVEGTVFCDTCFQQQFSGASHFISGATVAVECEDSVRRSSFYKEVKTNEHGKFSVDLPISVSKHVKKIKGCSVKLIKSSEPYCAVASTATSSSLHLKSKKQGTHIFSAGFFTFKPLNQPDLCSQKPSIQNSKNKLTDPQKSAISNPNDPTFYPPIQDPPAPGTLLPLPPLPLLPPLPDLPGLPISPVPKDTSKHYSQSEAVAQPRFFNPIGGLPLPPNPLLPPPSILPPNPFLPPPSIIPPIIPSPPPSIFPPLFPSPPPSIIPPIIPSPPHPPASIFPPLIPPLLPGLTPSPPPPPPSLFPPFPPLLPPIIPGFPGVPPAVTSSSLQKKNPSP